MVVRGGKGIVLGFGRIAKEKIVKQCLFLVFLETCSALLVKKLGRLNALISS
jgi:hypothetical protein